jgi:AcrR family transcriptional regulator
MIETPVKTVMSGSEGRERVLREARALFLERGYAEVSMQQIADAAGMTKASLYYHFRNKEELFAQVVRHEGERLLQGAMAELDGVDSFEEQLKRAAIFAFRATKLDIGRLMSDFQRHVSEECQQRLRRDEEDHLNPMKALLPYFKRAKSRGELKDVDPTTAIPLFFAMIGGMLKFSQHNPKIQLGDELADTLVDIYLRGVSAPANAP